MILPDLTEDMKTIGLLILAFVGFVFVFGIVPMLRKMAVAKHLPEGRIKKAPFKGDDE